MVKEYYNHWLPPMLGATAVTIGNNIFYAMSENKVTIRLRSHEMVHIEQFKKMGVVGFFLVYLSEYINGRLGGLDHWKAYRNISLEKEAYSKEHD